MIHEDKKELKRTNMLKYIKEGESKGFDRRPTCASRKRWYELGEVVGELLCMMSLNDRHIFWVNTNNYIDARFYAIYTKEKKYTSSLPAIFNSSLMPLFVELEGRLNLGQGALDVKVYEYENTMIIDPSKIKEEKINKFEKIINKLYKRNINSIFTELGASTPDEVSLEKVESDRRELDKIVMGEILGLSDEEQLEVYRAVVDLVKSRIEKAKSFGKRRKTKEGLDIDAVVKIVMEKIGDETLGKFYREKILDQKPLSTKTLPKVSGEVKIEKELYGWRLYYSAKRYIKCNSDEEARYLRVFLDLGIDNVKMPKDVEYMKIILPELEGLKVKISDIINSYLESIVNSKIRNRIEHRLWMEIIG